ncbi:MAG: ABC transporter permease [Acidimicrobiia bacterium]|nr:ABC transporter permease [Acidimicrobiia bacterium]MYB73716.1 ABC transporter permease [Acidimicrobiia bacterium]MYH98128.1 ABC transporter permease [Acidimicrobiia bacterium]
MTLLRYSLRSIAGVKVRFALTTLAVIIGVALTTGVLIATDGLRASLNSLAGQIYEKYDFTVRASSDVGDRNEGVPLLPVLLSDEIASVDGVEAVTGLAQEFDVVAIDGDGNALDPGVGRQIGYGWPENEALSTIYVYDDGISRQPIAPDEFAIDHFTGRENNFVIGQHYDIATPAGTENFELVGYLYFLDPETRIALQTVSWEMDRTRQLLHNGGGYDLIHGKLSPGASYEEVVAAIGSLVGPDIEVISRQDNIDESNAEFAGNIDRIQSLLLAFAIIVLIISAFITYNTFTLVMGQRIRELGLLRVLGAERRQIAQVVAVEALIVGIVATIVGFGLGILVAIGIAGALNSAGAHLPGIDVIIGGWTVVAALVIGIGVTMVTAIWPAMRARRVTPMVALADEAEIDPFNRRRALVIGSAAGGVGLILLLIGLFADLSTSQLLLPLGLGALLMLLGVNIATPAIARSMSLFLGWPADRLFTINGRLARLNAARNPRRTATTASALMIGLAMVSLVTVLGTSFKQTLNDQLGDSVEADWLVCVNECNTDLGTFSTALGAFSQEATQRMTEMPELESVMAFQFRPDGARAPDGEQRRVTATDLDSFSPHVNPGVVAGSLEGAGSGDVLVHKDLADDLDIGLGDQLFLEFPGEQEATFEVVALHTEDSVVGPLVVDFSDWGHLMGEGQDNLATAITAPGIDMEQARSSLETELSDFPQVIVKDQVEYQEGRASEIDTFLIIINVFLVLALLIAVVGISNTMALSIFERTRELGLVRAIGMAKRQTWGTIFLESIIVAVFGGLVGIATGVVAGSITAAALPSSVISTVSVPWLTLVIYLVVSALAGMLSAFFPARRANRLNVLEAIAHQ